MGLAAAAATRQRPGTAKGLIFLTLEDETGHANVIVMPDVYQADPGMLFGITTEWCSPSHRNRVRLQPDSPEYQ
jgi:hypothetical protein